MQALIRKSFSAQTLSKPNLSAKAMYDSRRQCLDWTALSAPYPPLVIKKSTFSAVPKVECIDQMR